MKEIAVARSRLIGLVLLFLVVNLGCNLVVQMTVQATPTPSTTETPMPITTPSTPTLQPTQAPPAAEGVNPRLISVDGLVSRALFIPEIREDCTYGSKPSAESPGFLPGEPEAMVVRSLAWHDEGGLCGMATAYVFEQNADAYTFFRNVFDSSLILNAAYADDWPNSRNAYTYSLNCFDGCLAQGVFANGNIVLYVLTRDVDPQGASSLMYDYLVEFYRYIEEESGGEYTPS